MILKLKILIQIKDSLPVFFLILASIKTNKIGRKHEIMLRENKAKPEKSDFRVV